MPRMARITVENAYYHIITRGNQKQRVFLEDKDHEKYLNILRKYKNKFKFKLFTFCLMPNHVHLLLQTEDPQILSKIMKCLNLSYTVYFNFKYKKVGHLWQDRFISRIIYKPAYLLDCIEYIENNPLRADLAKSAKKYPWSAYAMRLIGKDDLLDTPEI